MKTSLPGISRACRASFTAAPLIAPTWPSSPAAASCGAWRRTCWSRSRARLLRCRRGARRAPRRARVESSSTGPREAPARAPRTEPMAPSTTRRRESRASRKGEAISDFEHNRTRRNLVEPHRNPLSPRRHPPRLRGRRPRRQEGTVPRRRVPNPREKAAALALLASCSARRCCFRPSSGRGRAFDDPLRAGLLGAGAPRALPRRVVAPRGPPEARGLPRAPDAAPAREVGVGICLGLIGWTLTLVVSMAVASAGVLRATGPRGVPPLVRWIAALPPGSGSSSSRRR